MQLENDNLSLIARQTMALNSPVAYRRLVVHGSGDPEAKRLLQPLRPQDLLTQPIRDPEAGEALLAGLWLWHDWLDESHRIAQKLESPTGSYWHAIIHRREGDFANARYWYARCGAHPALSAMATAAANAGLDATIQGSRLVDWVEAVSTDLQHPRYHAAVQLQELEWRVLSDWCIAASVAISH